MLCSNGTGISTVEERLHAYVDERVEELRTELMSLMENHVRKYNSASEAPAPAGKTVSELPDDPFAEHHLDQQDVHELGNSIWDCVMLIGFDCIGLGESCMLVLLTLMNLLTQGYFCFIVLVGDMAEDPAENEVLDELLRFRTRVAHKVEYADVVSGRSLLSQVCNGEERLHVSGTQRMMHEDFKSFQDSGRFLVVLALLCWGSCVLAEVNSALRFAFAICQKKGESTRITLHPEGGYLLESLCSVDVAKTLMFSTIPRLAISSMLFGVGTVYLSRTSRNEDLLLNAMALAFIMEVDELFFAAFVPHRAKSLIRGLKPLLMKPLSRLRQQRFERINKVFGGSIDALLRVLILLVGLVLIHFMVLRPFHLRLKQATDILCSGQLDFVYSLNPANGMVVASRSSHALEEPWATEECAVLKLAKPLLRDNLGWDPPLPLCNDIPAPLVVRPDGATLDGESEFHQSHFDYVSRLARSDVQEAAGNFVCTDQVLPGAGQNSSANYLTALREAVGGNLTVLSCEDVRQWCHLQNMTRVRSLCPKTCECHLWGFTRAGVFKTPSFGCPHQCHAQAVAEEANWTAKGLYPLECVDFTQTRYFFPPLYKVTTRQALTVMDVDEDGNVSAVELSLAYMRHLIQQQFWDRICYFDVDEDGAWDTAEQSAFDVANEYLKRYDFNNDDSLSAEEVQSAGWPLFSPYADADGNGILTVAEMAGQPPNSNRTCPPLPKRITAPIEVGSDKYLLSLFEYVKGRPDFRRNLDEPVNVLGELLGLSHMQRQSVTSYFANGEFMLDWQFDSWQLAPGIPHPRNLVWCNFITSWEIVLLLGLNPCDHNGVASVRSFCPESCSCEAQMVDCPSSCPSIRKLAGSQ